MFTLNVFNTSLDLYHCLFYFFIYGFLGWCVEVGYQSLRLKKFVNRGFLNGAICPIYGAGTVMMLIICDGFIANWFLVFLIALFVPSLLELLTGIILLIIFKRKWWDYSDQKYNLFGFICLKFCLFWGFGGLILLKIVHPVVKVFVNIIHHDVGEILVFCFCLIYLIDLTVTIIQSSKYANNVRLIERLIVLLRTPSEFIGEKIHEQVESTYKEYEKTREKLAKTRLVRSYPKLFTNFKEKIILRKKDINKE